ncbi:hypothetical protein FRC12_015103 [Ceratobasidium sp. 428]|nr:hypothetical protein FRC12_015103 [Ceratobasidium sp. 428]
MKERKDFVGSSFTSSRLAFERISDWSGSNRRSRPFTTRFHQDWQHTDCPVMDWYHQQCESSTRFRSVEHHKGLDGPFYHEFLLLRLTDGAVCRVERIGEGSRTDAMRDFGCTARDLIQWFSDLDYDGFRIKYPSECIAEVDLSREFDIMDVLSICYSIQNTKICRAYTLQRYNCYFLCLTVLAVLTRRVASWETRINEDQWDLCLDSSLRGFGNLSPEAAKKHAILAICAYIDPENPQRAQFVFDTIREHLNSQVLGYTLYRETMRVTLWESDWEFIFRTRLAKSIETISNLFHDTGYCGQQLRRAVDVCPNDSEIAIRSANELATSYTSIFAKEQAKLYGRASRIHRNLWRMWQIEHPASSSSLAWSWLVSHPMALYLAFFPTRMSSYSSKNRWPFFQPSMRLAILKHGSSVISARVLDSLERSDSMQKLWIKAYDIAHNEDLEFAPVRILDKLASKNLLGPSEVALVLADQLDKPGLSMLLASLAASGLRNALPLMTKMNQAMINVVLDKPGPELGATCITISQFQDAYIKRRVVAHAGRVAAHQLAGEILVIEDIVEAMREAWKGLPADFGPVVSEPSVE